MAWVIAILGAALTVGGAVTLWSGSGYIRLDWGQAQTVAGTVALSAGVVTIAIAAVLFTLRDLARRWAPVAAVVPSSTMAAETAAIEPEAADVADGHQASQSERFADETATDGVMDRPTPVVARPDAAVADGKRPMGSSSIPADVGPDHDTRGRGVTIAVPEAPRSSASFVAEAPTVVGRYEANGASYVLFSDGTIEVETDSGTHRFASMAALKDHIERQDAG